MRYWMLVLFLGFTQRANSFWPASYRVDLNDRKEFVITAGDDDNNDNDDEDEMIRPEELSQMAELVDDEARYKPLHSHVEHYNRRAAEAAERLSRAIPEISIKESDFEQEEKPFIAGFKHQLDKYNFHQHEKLVENIQSKRNDSIISSSKMKLKIRKRKKKLMNDSTDKKGRRDRFKREDDNDDEGNPNIRLNDDENTDTSDDRVTSYEKPVNKFDDTELTTEYLEKDEEEEIYDYEKFRDEYEHEIAEVKSSNVSSNNYTKSSEPEDTKDAIEKIADTPKNCSEEEMTKFGVKSFECLAHDYKNMKNKTDVRKMMTRTWNVVRVWICIYVCIAVPAWCQKGWCCCCFRCGMCFPNERIAIAKDYYAHNERGIFVDQPSQKGKQSEPIKYQPTLFEINAYEELESAIRNL